MIKPEELRIWNWVLVDGVPTIITGIAQDGSGNYGYNMFYGSMPDFYSCEPIPLTPEILEKAGFEGERKWLMIELPPLCIHADLNTMNVGLYTLDDGAADQLIKRVAYVHQLQNLYHSLTGQELTINLHAAI